MTSPKVLAGVAHDVAAHAGSGMSFLSPHLAEALRSGGIETTSVELLEVSPYPAGAPERESLRRSLQALHTTTVSVLRKHGFELSDVRSIRLHVTPVPWDDSGFMVHTRVVITAANGRTYDSGWLE